jgi:uncharacterized repeat protein (TIGR01451 family)
MKTQAFLARCIGILCAGLFIVQFGAVAAQTSPTITSIADQTVNEGVATAALSFTVGDAETPAASLTMSGSSSNTTLVPNANIIFGGSGASRTVTVTPAANLSGSATITLTVTDGSASTATTSFLLTVNPVNAAPSFTLAASQTITFSSSTVVTVSNFATAIDDGDPDVTQTLTFNVTNTNNALFTPAGQPSIDAAGTLTYTPSGVFGVATLNVTLTDDATAGGAALTTAAQSRTITINNPAPALTYNPNPNATPTPLREVYFFDGAPLPGQTRNSVIAVTPSAGTGANTSTVDSCAITGPDASNFSSVAGVNLSFVGATTTAQNIALSCTSGTSNRSGTLTCNETRGTAPIVQRVWPLNCPSCYLNISETLDTTAPAISPALGVASATGQQTGRINRFGVDSVCGGGKTFPGDFATTGARQYDRYTITPQVAGCVKVRMVASGNPSLFLMVASPFVPATPGSNWVADPGASFITDNALSFTAVAGQSYDVVVHEVNPGGGIGQAYTLQVDTCNVPPPTATLSIDDVSLNEGNSGSTNAMFTVTRSNNTTAFSVPYSTTAGTATAGGDFTATSGTLNFTVGGALTQTISVPVLGDTLFEADKTFTVSLGTVVNTTGFTEITKANGLGTILNDDSRSADLSITKTNGGTTLVPGNGVTYTITASNAGPDDALGSTVADTLPASLTGATWTCVGAGGGTCTASGSSNINDTVNLPAGASVTYTVSATVSASATGVLSNTATVTPASGVVDSVPGNNSATDADTLTPQANLAITKTNGVTTLTPGGSVTYTIVASNSGPSNAPGSTVTDTLPAALTVATWTCVGAGGGTCTASGSGNINDTVNLPAGGSVTYTLTASVSNTATGSLINTATVAPASGIVDPATGNNSATDTDSVTAQANLSITKTDGTAQATRGGSITYTIVASNAGPSNAPGSTVADTLPATLTGATWTCVGAGGGTCTASGSGNISDTVNLPAGANVTYTLTATVGNTAVGTLSNTATISPASGVVDPTPGNNSATDTNTVLVPTLVVTSAAASGNGNISCVSPVDFGNTTTCTITPAADTRLVSISGCGGTTVTGNTYVTGPITVACTVTAAFTSTIVNTMPKGPLIAFALLTALVGFASIRRRA